MEHLQLERIVLDQKDLRVLLGHLNRLLCPEALENSFSLLFIIDHKLRIIEFNLDFICYISIVIVLFEERELIFEILREGVHNWVIYNTLTRSYN